MYVDVLWTVGFRNASQNSDRGSNIETFPHAMGQLGGGGLFL